jgi:hypothetical protein
VKTLRASTVCAVVIFLSICVCNAAPSPTKEVPVTVRVHAQSGGSIPDAYIAFVPGWRPTNHPLVETIAAKGVADLRISPGTYLVIAGARGYALYSHETSITPSSGALSLELHQLKEAHGTVAGEDGRALSGVRVERINAAIPVPLGTLSALAARQLGPDWSTTTDEAGRWTLGLPDATVPLLFEIPGFGAEWRVNTKGDDKSMTSVLTRGSGLRLTTDRSDADLIVTLAAEPNSASTSIPAEQQPLLWGRATAPSSRLEWSSLPQGTYGIFAKYPDPLHFMQRATKIGAVTLAPGEMRVFHVALPPAKVRAERSLSFFVPDLSRAELGSNEEGFARSVNGSPVRADAFVEDVSGGSVVYLRADGVRSPFYMLTDDYVLSALPASAEPMERARNDEPLAGSVRHRADVVLRLRAAEASVPVPESGIARFPECDGGSDLLIPFNLQKNSAVGFSAAAGCPGMVLEVGSFEPLIFESALHAGRQDLGEVLLQAPAAADIHVLRDPSGDVVTNATVEISARGHSVGGGRISVAKGTTDEHGWVTFPRLPANRELTATARGSDDSSSDAVALRVAPRTRGLIDPLLLKEPASVLADIKIDDAVLRRFATARVLSVTLRPADPTRESEALQREPANGPVLFRPLHPGTWMASAVVSVEGSWSLSQLKNVELKAGETQTLDEAIIPNVFEGTVTSDGKGVAAKVLLDADGQKQNFTADGNGRFVAILQKPGIYSVGVARMSTQSNVLPVGDVAFTDPSKRIELAIPKGASVTASVRMGGHPVPKTLVWLSRRGDTGMVDSLTNRGRATDSAGQTAFDDLAPGVWTFTVRDVADRSSVQKSITVESGRNDEIELDLAKADALEGIVRDPGGMPLAGAKVDCLFAGPAGNPDRASVVSDSEGAFSIQLIAPVPESALCSISTPAGQADAARLTPAKPSDFTMTASTGALRISGAGDVSNFDALWLVTPDGRALSLRAVASSLGQFGNTVVIPGLASGPWKLVKVETRAHWAALVAGLGQSLPPIGSITLRPGATELFRLDSGSARP